MASPNCWRCLLRPSVASPSPSPSLTSYLGSRTAAIPPTTSTTTSTKGTIPSSIHHFSTTAPTHAPGVHQRLGKRMKLSKFKKKTIVQHKTPEPGARKKWRKRVVLSNNNAVPVEGLGEMTDKNLGERASSGQVLKIPDFAIDQLRASEAFKSSQTWGLFRSPHTLVRSETVTVCSRMLEAAAEGRTARLVVSGERAAGKSMVLTQAMANAFLNKWVVIHVPEGTP